MFDINCSICCISQILKFRLDLIQYSVVGRIVSGGGGGGGGGG